ncbi:MAG: phosphoribosylanthranilate isomerase [Pseudomonadota bacterium]
MRSSPFSNRRPVVPDQQVQVKICGLTERPGLAAAVNGGARYIGLNFFPPSPRFLTLEAAADLCAEIPPGVCKVALTVDADDDTLDDLLAKVPVDMLQLQGSEPPARVAAVKSWYGLPVMKAVGISGPDDLAKLDTFAAVADQLLVDAKPPSGSTLPGGNRVVIDWSLLTGRRWPVPWLLAGGLNADNVAEAIRVTGAQQVDVSSGVESARGVKDPERVRAFLAAARDPAPAL